MARAAKKTTPARKTCGTIKRHGQVVWRDPSALVGYDRNSRTHSAEQIRQVRASIDEFGFTNPILLKGDDKTIGAGHARQLAALLDPPLEEVPTIVLQGLSAEQWRAYVIADNRLALNAGWDEAILSSELKLLDDGGFDLSLLGFNDGEIATLLNPLGEGLTDPDEVPKPPARPVTKPGDVWLLGKHRIRCGDSMDRDDVAALFGGEVADFILTDPPYCSGGFQEAGRAAGSTDGMSGKKIARDNLTTEGLSALLEGVISRQPCEGACYVFCDWRQIFAVRKAVEPIGYQYRALLVWDKETAGMGGPWRHQYEMAYFGTRRKEPATGISGDVLRCKRSGNQHHTTEKPAGLIRAMIANTKGNLIADPFCGSGTTIIAAQAEGRRCFAMELSPAYVDVAVIRWQDFTGQLATLEATGETFESLRAKRNRSVRRAGREAKAA